jgi:hypothetical protein
VELTVGGDFIDFLVINQRDSNAVLGTITIERTGGGGGGG